MTIPRRWAALGLSALTTLAPLPTRAQIHNLTPEALTRYAAESVRPLPRRPSESTR
jgi:hypothetical protein